jgi:hypothetical protein
MRNKDYGMVVLAMALTVMLSACATPHSNLWSEGWCGSLTASPQTDL